MTSQSQVFGKEAEVVAEQYLRKHGYRIVGRNVRFPNGELDIVAKKDGTIVFIEVKARRTNHFGGASYAVTPHKQQRLIFLAAQYLACHQLSDNIQLPIGKPDISSYNTISVFAKILFRNNFGFLAKTLLQAHQEDV